MSIFYGGDEGWSWGVYEESMFLVICPGVHEAALTNCFLEALQGAMRAFESSEVAWLAREQLYGVVGGGVPFSGHHTHNVVKRWCDRTSPLVFIAFSAGVVGAITAACLWQDQGGRVESLIAVDGWGVPRWGNFPFYRVSHDEFTHWTSALLGAGTESFYGDPAVSHLDLWQRPEQTLGWQLSPLGAVRCSAITAIASWLRRSGCGTRLQPKGK